MTYGRVGNFLEEGKISPLPVNACVQNETYLSMGWFLNDQSPTSSGEIGYISFVLNWNKRFWAEEDRRSLKYRRMH
jgi:hypothetical protein